MPLKFKREMAMTQVLITAPIQQSAFNSVVDTFPNVTFHLQPSSNSKDPQLLSECEVLATFGEDFDAAIIESMPRLNFLQVFKAGVDNLPLKELQKKGVLVSNVRGIHRNSVSEYVFGCILSLSLNLFAFRENQKDKVWFRNINREELFQKTIGVIGAGSIGREVARKAKAFGMYTLGINFTGRPVPHFDRVYPPGGISELLASSDFVLMALPLTEATRHFMDDRKFAMMKPDSCFINIARGRVVDEQALIRALERKKIRAAVLDVFEREPLPADSPLWAMQNVILTPHIAGVSPVYMERAMEIFRHNLSVYLGTGRNFINLIDLERGY